MNDANFTKGGSFAWMKMPLAYVVVVLSCLMTCLVARNTGEFFVSFRTVHALDTSQLSGTWALGFRSLLGVGSLVSAIGAMLMIGGLTSCKRISVFRRYCITSLIVLGVLVISVWFLPTGNLGLAKLLMVFVAALLCAGNMEANLGRTGQDSVKFAMYKFVPASVAGLALGSFALPNLPGEQNSGYILKTDVLKALHSISPDVADSLKHRSVHVIVFSDPVCPACKFTLPRVWKAVDSEWQGRAKVSYFQYPLTYHREAASLSRIEVLAERMGRFGPTFDAILNFDGDKTKLLRRLSEVGLGSPSFIHSIYDNTSDIGHECENVVAREKSVGDRLGLTGTPFFIVLSNDDTAVWTTGGYVLPIVRQYLAG